MQAHPTRRRVIVGAVALRCVERRCDRRTSAAKKGCRHCASPVGGRSPRQVSRALTRHSDSALGVPRNRPRRTMFSQPVLSGSMPCKMSKSDATWPSIRKVPPPGFTLPASTRRSLVLAAPLWPTRPTRSLCWRCRVTASRAWTTEGPASLWMRPPVAAPTRRFLRARELASSTGNAAEWCRTADRAARSWCPWTGRSGTGRSGSGYSVGRRGDRLPQGLAPPTLGAVDQGEFPLPGLQVAGSRRARWWGPGRLAWGGVDVGLGCFGPRSWRRMPRRGKGTG